MNSTIQKYISNLVANQFPDFYKSEGPVFIEFVKAYYEWMESSGNPIGEARNLLSYRDIDLTLEGFLVHFQKKYLYGIPFDVIINKRYLLKHIFDVYRSKGSIQCYKLLFRLIYDEDIEIYLPSQNVIKASDGKWAVPTYIEISQTENIENYKGKTIKGLTSGTTAVVENFIKQYFNKSETNCFYISNVLPKGGNFTLGEKLILTDQTSNSEAILIAPSVLGSLQTIDIVNGGQNFKEGDILKIVYRDPLSGEFLSSGTDGLVRVLDVKKAYGELTFRIEDGGFGYLANSLSFVYPDPVDTVADKASFKVQSIINTKRLNYYTDLIVDHVSTTLNSNTFGFPANTSANLTSVIGTTLNLTNAVFGSIYTLTNIYSGNGYTKPATTFVRSTLKSNNLPGTITFSTSSNTVTGSGTSFATVFQNNMVICLRPNPLSVSSDEYHMIKKVINDTSLVLYDTPKANSIVGSEYFVAPSILKSNYYLNHPVMYNPAGEWFGENETISAFPSYGDGVINKVRSINSGKGYVENEIVVAYLYNGITDPVIIHAGSGYANNEKIKFFGGNPTTSAEGFILTDSNGAIETVSITNHGSDYKSVPNYTIVTANGSGAELLFEISEFNTANQVRGKVVKSGIGYGLGSWETSDGFLNSDQYIQDSYYYQDYSYDVRVSLSLETYKDILYNTFHVAGTELFGSFLRKTQENSPISIEFETVEPGTNLNIIIVTCDSTAYTVDNSNTEIACDAY